jgi:predicted DNA-binding mobile mystery protein A
MSQSILAKQLSVTQQSVAQLERQEASDRITIAKLREVAESLNCEVHVLVVPREPLAERIEKRAELVAKRELDRVITTMTLEDQRPSDDFINYTIKKRVEELKVAERKRLWQ